ncbi:MAG TPA: hypothetical protein VE287_06155 [Actinopolymorphaceae bacterium]|jgi:hypothetical protein|nr:hypothetical protein [Actinopolymorphaceae bacterium]
MHVEQEPRERFTDEELAFLRFVRFGRLPERVHPDEFVTLVETDPPDELPGQAFDPREWGEAGRLL